MLSPRHTGSDRAFIVGLSILGGLYVVLIVAMIVADAFYTSPGHIAQVLSSPQIRYAIKLSLIASTLSAILSVWIGVPLGYLMSRTNFPGKNWVDAVVDIPILLPPLVVGISLLILFRFVPGVTYSVTSVVIAQFSVACAFAVRTMRVTFDQISPRSEEVAMTLGCTRGRAFWTVTLPEAHRGILTAFTLAWARSLGEFGPVLVFSGATRMKTEVLATTVFLELSIGDLEAAVAVSLLMVISAVLVLVALRLFGTDASWRKAVRP